MLEILYVFLLASVIPFFSWQQREEGRNLVSMLITGVFVMLCLMTGGIPFGFDHTTIVTLCFALWAISSVMWSNSRQSCWDMLFLICSLMVFLVSRKIPLPILMGIVFVPGIVFSAVSLYYQSLPVHPHKNIRKIYFVFGNNNHLGSFLMVPLFAGAWLTFNVSWWIAPLVVLMVFGIAVSKCIGAQIGTIIGLLCVALHFSIWTLLLIPIILGFLLLIYKKKSSSINHRLSVIMGSLLLIIKAPIFGYGLRTFRKEYPNIMPELRDSGILKQIYDVEPGIETISSHRIHNDHLELIFELGVVGYLLFLGIFSALMWTANPLLAGAIIAFAVHGLFFFPLREAHTAFPFWALAGGMAHATGTIVLNPFITVVIGLITIQTLYWTAIKTLGLHYYNKSVKISCSSNPQEEDEAGKRALRMKQLYLNTAIRFDPYNNTYLTGGYYYNVFEHPEVAFNFASRCIENFDGGRVKWGVCDQYARALLRIGGFGAAKLALKHALHICPDFKQSLELVEIVKNMEQQEMQRKAL